MEGLLSVLRGCGGPGTLLLLMVTVMTMTTTMTVASSTPPPKAEVQPKTPVKPHVRLHDKRVLVNITRYGSNLCHECTTTIMPCVQTKTLPCSFSEDGGVLFSKTNGTKPALKDEDDDDDDDDDIYSDKAFYKGRRRKRATHYSSRRERRRRRWQEWWNNDSEESEDSDDKDKSKDKDKDKGGSNEKPRLALCRYNFTKQCWEKRCEMKCCDGSPMDAKTNGCRDTDDGGLVKSCLNGGTLSGDKSHCQCPEGFSGLQCQNRKCSVKCQNGGICQTRTPQSGSLAHTTHNDDYCVCPIDTKGTFCEEKVCTLGCKNNGTCISSGSSLYRYTWCRCQGGFFGQLCEKGHRKEGECPKRSALQSCSPIRWRHECTDDSECPDIRKCCRNACYHHVCVYPNNENASCIFGNETYSLGIAFRPDPCHLCTCNASHVGAPQGVVECARIRCPPKPKYCTNLVTREGECCPVCEEDPGVAVCAGNYTYPHFTNCPRKQVVVEVDSKDTNLATVVNLGLEAQDCKGDPLDVMYSMEKVTAGKGEDNFQLLTATSARDDKGNFAQCAFHIRIHDPYPPEFLTCPLDMAVPKLGPVEWEVPIARDNVGLARPPTSRRNPGIRLGPGQYVVEYLAEDFQGNKAICKFVITVEKGNGFLPHPADHDHDHDHPIPQTLHQHQLDGPSHSSTAIGVGVASLLIVIVLIALAAFFWCRQRGATQNSSGVAQPGIATPNGPGSRAARWNLNAAASSGGVPQYSLPPQEVMSPPVYSQVDDMIAGLGATGGQEAGELPVKTSLA
ncbi:uncharacterized protein LOC143297862 isoform X2 [Babylonia areolata]|uniref:uncharacterized protein LOC143297862 isoform X2 n=1 Tax=Babylonia areolata TaxID=304850 RepID=UPI003FD5E340